MRCSTWQRNKRECWLIIRWIASLFESNKLCWDWISNPSTDTAFELKSCLHVVSPENRFIFLSNSFEAFLSTSSFSWCRLNQISWLSCLASELSFNQRWKHFTKMILVCHLLWEQTSLYCGLICDKFSFSARARTIEWERRGAQSGKSLPKHPLNFLHYIFSFCGRRENNSRREPKKFLRLVTNYHRVVYNLIVIQFVCCCCLLIFTEKKRGWSDVKGTGWKIEKRKETNWFLDKTKAINYDKRWSCSGILCFRLELGEIYDRVG